MNAHRLAWLEDLPVVTEDGARLGHLFEIRSPGRAETEPIHDARKVGHFLCGKRGAQAGRAGADDQQRHLRLERLTGYDGAAHQAPIVFI